MNSNTKLVLPELSYKIMGVLFTVHNELGPLMLEKYYQKLLRFADALDMRLSIRFLPK